MPKYPKALASLIQYLKKLPGVGQKTAERFAFQIFSWREEDAKNLSSLLGNLHDSISICNECGCLMEENICRLCDINLRNTDVICVVSSPKDIYPVEEMRSFTGLYHVLGGLLSPIEGIQIEKLRIKALEERIQKYAIQEIILAFDSTIEGDATALYVKKIFQESPIHISRLALGLPMGSSLDYIDGGTLMKAFAGRQPL